MKKISTFMMSKFTYYKILELWEQSQLSAKRILRKSNKSSKKFAFGLQKCEWNRLTYDWAISLNPISFSRNFQLADIMVSTDVVSSSKLRIENVLKVK